MDPSLVAQGGLAVALAMSLVAIQVLWKQLLKVQAQRDAERELTIPALLASSEVTKAAGDALARDEERHRLRDEERLRQVEELKAEIAKLRSP